MEQQIKKGEELFLNGRIEEAESLFLDLLKRSPDHPELLNNLGVLCHSHGRISEAESYFKQALQAVPGHDDALVNLASLYQEEKRWQEAAQALERALETKEDPSLYKHLGLAALEMGDPDRAREALRRSLELAPGQEDVRKSFEALEASPKNETFPFRCAFAQIDITPRLQGNVHVVLQGMAGAPRKATKASTPLMLQMLLLEDNNYTKTLFVSADIFAFGPEITSKVINSASQWGIESEAVFLNASHTHYAPGTLSHCSEAIGPFYQDYANQIATTIIQHLPILYNRLEPCKISHGFSKVKIGINRRLEKEGKVIFAPNPDGYYQEITPFLLIQTKDKNKKLLLVNHACHPTGLGLDASMSADYVGYMRQDILDSGPVSAVMFLQGAAGSSKEATRLENGDIHFSNAPEAAEENGRKLSSALKRALKDDLQTLEGTFYFTKKRLTLPLASLPQQSTIDSLIDNPNTDPLVRSWAKGLMERFNNAPQPQAIELDLQFMGIGDRFALISLPGEPVAELAKMITDLPRWPSAWFFLGYTNGLVGYLPTAEMLEQGGYEAEASHLVYLLPSPLTQEAEPIITSSAAACLEAWLRKDEPNGYGRYHLARPPKKFAFFVLSAGRCGTMTLAHLLNTATNARVWHHPQPDLINEALLAHWGRIDKKQTFWRARYPIIHKTWAEGLIHGETDHLITPFCDMLAEEIPDAKFIVLVRDPRDFVRSGMRRGYYQNHPWDSGRLRPMEGTPEFENWKKLDQFQKICWLWNETYSRILNMTANLHKERYKVIRLKDLTHDLSLLKKIFKFLNLNGFSIESAKEVLARNLNRQDTGDFPDHTRWDEPLHSRLYTICGKVAKAFGYNLDSRTSHQSTSDKLKPKLSRITSKPKLLFLELPGTSTGGHLDHIVKNLSADYDIKYLKTTSHEQIAQLVRWADIIWLEWANQLAVHVTNQIDDLKTKPVICRLHGYEVFTDLPSKINWQVVDKLIFVAKHKQAIFNQKFNVKTPPQIVIRNGVDITKFTIPANKRNTKKLVLLGHLNFRKGLPLLLQFYYELLQRDPAYHLYIRGEFQDPRLEMAAQTMIDELDLRDKIDFVGWVDNLNEWLADKSHILSFSLEESFHYAIGNGMAAGMKPLIHAWHESRQIWPEQFIFRNLDEFLELATTEEFTPHLYRQLLYDYKLTLDYQLAGFSSLIEKLADTYQPSGISPSANKAHTIKTWYDQKYRENKSAAYRNKFSYKPVADLLHLTEEDTVLDIGAGQGFFLDWLGEYAKKTVGLDISRHALLECQKNAPTSQACLGTGESLPFKSGQFSALVCNGVLEHFQSIESGLSEFYRVLQSGGKALINVPNVNFRYWTAENKGTAQQEIQETLYSFHEWKALIERAGFNIVDVKTDNFIAPFPHRLSLEESYQFIFLCRKGKKDDQWFEQLKTYDGHKYTQITNDLLKNGDLSSAYFFLKQLISIYPKLNGLLRLMGILCRQFNRNSEADGYFTDYYGAPDKVTFQYRNKYTVNMKIIPGDHISNVLQSGNFYEIKLLEYTLNKYGNNLNIIDIGGHIGNHTVYWGLIGNACRIDVFEPNTQTRQILFENIKLNNLSNVTVHSCAIGKTEGRGKLEKLNDKNTGSTRVNSAEPGEIIIRPLTNYVNGDIDLIKIDVEGMGAEVLAGALTILRLQKPILIIECGNRKEYDEVAKILLPLQYRPVKRFNHTPTIIFEHNPEPSKFPEYQEALLMT